MARIDQLFETLKRQKRKALVGYITAGFPTLASLKQLVPLLETSGIDLLEIGIPFSDPMADGPIIQRSSQIALSQGATLGWIMKTVQALRKTGVRLPIVFMTYCNPIYAMGIDRFFKSAKACGIDGLIIPDMIPEEAADYAASAKKADLSLIYLVAPTTPPRRIRMIAGKTQGFLYVVSLTGVTGVRKELSPKAIQFVKTVKTISKKPVIVGFGLSTPSHVRTMAACADGVIVGSALIREIEKSKHHGFQGVARFVRSLRNALDR